ncbi:MAG: AraC family transcriptional regulator [Victivallales bacterium]|jgi:AraC-like DNA-binding protein|nr:AraC family transcriptional regulator [Victivallales bacterium]
MMIAADTSKFFNVHRPNPDVFPHIPLPFYPRSTGHFKVVGPGSEYVPAGAKSFVQLFWTISGSASVRIDQKEYTATPGDVFYLLPYEIHDFRVSLSWEYRWIAFDGEFAARHILSYKYPRNCFAAGECPHDLFIRFDQLMREMTPSSWREMVALIDAILAQAGGDAGDHSKEGKIVAEIIRLCRKDFANPDLNVNAVADKLCLDRSTIRRIFVKRMKLSLSEYIADLRLQHALSLLRQSFLPISEIARQTGIPEPSYFCRFIRRNIGKSPEQFRHDQIIRPKH